MWIRERDGEKVKAFRPRRRGTSMYHNCALANPVLLNRPTTNGYFTPATSAQLPTTLGSPTLATGSPLICQVAPFNEL